ncbi:hypothetical protein [Aequorivita marina]|uniref:hypothetical protein n=1 Tax=Aequorivita marina TaxID=3073654 RepID=UPI002875936F|nr:hypothetical protein [Aequorivita sp. S2608]MDS1297131.1 hypothetical protein [Aequorivita sp. S2608]
MKTTTFLLVILFISSVGVSQERTEINVDSMLVNIDKTTFTSGILYDRVSGLAQLKTFNDTVRPAHHTYFKQALLELYRASNKNEFLPVKELERLYTADSLQNQVDIGIINATYHTVNYDPDNIENGALDIRDGLFVQINNNPPFLPNHVFIAAPLKLHLAGENVVFNFNRNLLLQRTEGKNIKTLVADFGIQRPVTVIENGEMVQEKIEIPYSEISLI